MLKASWGGRGMRVVESQSELSGATAAGDATRTQLHKAALRLGRAINYSHVGIVEFLIDVDTGEPYFIEVNPRIQVEHRVSEEVTDIDIVKAQILILEGARIGGTNCGVLQQVEITLHGYTLHCCVTKHDAQAVLLLNERHRKRRRKDFTNNKP